MASATFFSTKKSQWGQSWFVALGELDADDCRICSSASYVIVVCGLSEMAREGWKNTDPRIWFPTTAARVQPTNGSLRRRASLPVRFRRQSSRWRRNDGSEAQESSQRLTTSSLVDLLMPALPFRSPADAPSQWSFKCGQRLPPRVVADSPSLPWPI
jgi:hypothetical protein